MSSSSDSSSSKAFRPDIEGMRGIAVLLVVLFHSGVPGFSGGFIGVDVFFALSGYLITGIILHELAKTGTFSFRNFYARRARRLLPAAGFAAISTVVLSILLYSPLELARYAKWASYTSMYASNFMFMRDASNYFASDVGTNPFLHTWSLAVEEQFYFFWPALIALTLIGTKSRRWLAFVLVGISVISLTMCIWLTHYRAPWAFFSLPTRAWEFGLGGLGCMLPERLVRGRKGVVLFGWLGFAGVLASACLYTPQTTFPGFTASLPVVGTIAVLVAGVTGSGYGPMALLDIAPLQYLGRLSYSWYLWHWPILLLAGIRFPGISWQGKLLAATLALVIANITFVILEKPIRFHPYLVPRPILSLALVPVVAVAGISASFLGQRIARRALHSQPQASFWAAANDQRVLFDAHCLTSGGSTRLAECNYGDTSSDAKVILFGDSHAEHWFPAVNQLALDNHWQLVTLLKSSCPAADVKVFNTSMKREDTECEAWRQSALARIAELQPELVIISESDGPVADSTRQARSYALSPAAWKQGLRATMSYLDSQSIHAIFIADVPRPGFDVPTCLSRATAHEGAPDACNVARALALNEDARTAEQAALNGLKQARLLDFADTLCPKQVCPTMVAGQVVYRDSDHLTSSFAHSLTPLLEHEIEAMAIPPGQPNLVKVAERENQQQAH